MGLLGRPLQEREKEILHFVPPTTKDEGRCLESLLDSGDSEFLTVNTALSDRSIAQKAAKFKGGPEQKRASSRFRLYCKQLYLLAIPRGGL